MDAWLNTFFTGGTCRRAGRLPALLFALSVFVMANVPSTFAAIQSQHECPDLDCAICACVVIAQQLAHGMDILSPMPDFTLPERMSGAAKEPAGLLMALPQTLVSQKIRLNA